MCGADLLSDATTCWLCYAAVAPQASHPRPQGATSTAARELVSGFSLASLLMFVTLVSVVLGVFTLAPGLGVLFAIVAFVVWARTASAVRVRAERGRAMTTAEKVQMFLGSFGVAVAMIVLVLVSGCAALCSACFILLGADVSDSRATGIGLIAGLIAVAGIFAIVKLSKFGRRRWRRQIGDQD